MVFTDPVRPGAHLKITRRTALAVGVAAASSLLASGCGGDQRRLAGPAPQPLAPMLAGTLDLAQRYQDALTAQPGLGKVLTPLLAETRTHAAALAKAMGQPLPSASAVPPTSLPPVSSPAPASPTSVPLAPADPSAAASGGVGSPSPVDPLAGAATPPDDAGAAGALAGPGAAGPGSATAGSLSPSPAVGGPASPNVVVPDAATLLAGLRAAEQQARSRAVEACLAAQARYASLLGSIAASRACHVEVLA